MNRETLHKILEDSRLYPSPHNSQPMRIKIVADNKLELYYDLRRGLPAESFGAQFGYVCTGVFIASFEVVAAHYGFASHVDLKLTEMDFTRPDPYHLMGEITLQPKPPTEADETHYQSYLKRQTSRIPYDNRLVEDAATRAAVAEAAKFGYVMHVSSDQKQVDEVIKVNQRTLFYDLENDAVHQELMTWLRFSEEEAKSKADGLSAKTMLVNGKVLKFAITHRKLWHLPVIGGMIRTIYLNTMRGVRQIAWLEGPFATMDDFVRAGACFMHVWLELTHYDVFLHPYGTVITNPRSHKEFVDLVHQSEGNGRMAWMLFRFGYSKQPPKSYRRDLTEMVIE